MKNWLDSYIDSENVRKELSKYHLSKELQSGCNIIVMVE